MKWDTQVIITGSTPELETFRVFLLGGTGGCADILDLCNAINLDADRSNGLALKSLSTKQILGHQSDVILKQSVSTRVKVEGILDDRLFKSRVRDIDGIPVCGGFDDVKKIDSACFFTTALGHTGNFRQRISLLKSLGLSEQRFISLIHPSCSIAASANIGLGCVIHYNSFLGRNTSVNNWTLILPGAVIGHGSRIGVGCIINSGVNIAGDTFIGDSCYLGAGSLIRDHLTIADGTLVGMGAVVVRSVIKNSTTIYGSPARLKIPI